MTQPFDFEKIEQSLYRLGADIAAAEFHGTLCGILCSASGKVDEWFMKSFPPADASDALAQEAAQALVSLYQETMRQLNDPTCDFHLLLPDDESSMEQRTEALGEWCQGFLIGLGTVGITDYSTLPEEAAEVCQDMIEIARAASYDIDSGEEDEAAFADLEEYVRVGVLLVNEALQPNRQAPGTQPTLH